MHVDEFRSLEAKAVERKAEQHKCRNRLHRLAGRQFELRLMAARQQCSLARLGKEIREIPSKCGAKERLLRCSRALSTLKEEKVQLDVTRASLNALSPELVAQQGMLIALDEQLAILGEKLRLRLVATQKRSGYLEQELNEELFIRQNELRPGVDNEIGKEPLTQDPDEHLDATFSCNGSIERPVDIAPRPVAINVDIAGDPQQGTRQRYEERDRGKVAQPNENLARWLEESLGLSGSVVSLDTLSLPEGGRVTIEYSPAGGGAIVLTVSSAPGGGVAVFMAPRSPMPLRINAERTRVLQKLRDAGIVVSSLTIGEERRA